MKCSLAKLPAPVLAGVVRERNAAAAIAEIINCTYDGAGMIDLHMSCLEQTDTETLRKIISASRLPILALNYNRTWDWQDANLSEEERTASFLRAVEAGAAGVDIQGYTFHRPSKEGFCGQDKYSFTKGNPKEIVTDADIISKQCEFIRRVHHAGAEVLLSCHPGIFMNRQQVVELALFLEERNPDIIKIVTTTSTEEEALESIQTMVELKKAVKTPVSYHTSSPLSRIVNPILGGHIAFCVDRFKESSTTAQLDLKTAKAVMDNIHKITL